MSNVFQKLFRSGSRENLKQPLRVASGERLYVVGDIHGRNDLLVAMLSKIVQDAHACTDTRKPRFVFLGDYIDRGDHSADVLETLSTVGQVGEQAFDFLMGNHEAAMLSFLEDPIAGADWISWGGRQTLTSYGIGSLSRKPDKVELIAVRDTLYEKSQLHLPFLRALKRYVVSGDVICVHASIDPALSLEAQPDDALLWGQNPSGESAGLPGHLMVHGHFADYEPVVRGDRICVDTGAYYSGRLTAVRLDDEQTFLHVDVQDLMP